MLTITTNKEEVAGIATGAIKEKALPLSDFWEKRVLNLLGFSEADRREIIHNLCEDRKGTTDARREVRFTAGGAATVRVMATFRIGRVSQDAAKTFILTIVEILEARGLEEIEETAQKTSGGDAEAGEAASAPFASSMYSRQLHVSFQSTRDFAVSAIRRVSSTRRTD